jgi:YidC/Oxa1 family membrane protein insertase
MEKRAIIAGLLSFMVLIIWAWFFGPKSQKAPVKDEFVHEGPEKTSPRSDAVRLSGKQVSQETVQVSKEAPLPLLEEKEIHVDTPLYRAVFSSAGARLKSFKLKKYHVAPDKNSPLIELADLDKGNKDILGFSFVNAKDPEAGTTLYDANEEFISLGPESSPRDLTFTSSSGDGLSVVQTFRISPDRYPIDLTVAVSNRSQKEIQGNVQATLRATPPKEKSSYYAFNGLAFLLNGKLEKVESGKLKEDKVFSGAVGWMAYEKEYFMTAVVLEDDGGGKISGRLGPSGILDAKYEDTAISIQGNGHESYRFTLYLGPRDLAILKQLGKKLDLAINFGWTDPIAKPLLYTLRFFNAYVHNYGVAIILLTALIKILFWPLTHKSYKSMKDLQKLQPLMAKIREKHKDNKEAMNRELMALYKTYKVNPMGGCLPMIIQIPVFFALFRILGNSIELRHAHFWLWIKDLSAPDRLFADQFPFQIPYMAPPSGIPVLTLLMGLSMFVQQKMTPTPGDPTQAKIMMFLPLIFTVMFINFPSGLVLYWLVNNILSIGQQYGIKRR